MTTTETGAVRAPNPRLALALLALPAMLIAIDISVLSVALPEMAADLHPSTAELLWMNDIYGFMVGGTMITMGAVGDRIGRRRLIVICSAVFAVASALAAFAVEPWMVIATRAVMGVAGAAIMPASMALIGRIFLDPKRSIAAMGAYMTCFLTGMAAAPLVGGLMMAHWWWGSVFLLGVPIMVLVLFTAPRLLPEFRAPHAGRLDLASAALCLVAILLLVAALKLAVGGGWSWQVPAAAVAGVALGAVFVRRQRTLDDPLVDLSLLRRPGVARVMWVLFLTALLMGGTSIFWAFYLQNAQGLSPLQAALWLLPSTAAMMVASNLGPWLGRRVAPSRVVVGGLAVMAAGFASYALVSPGRAGIVAMVCGSVLATAGIGAVFPFLMNDVISRAPQERAGSAAAFVQTANEIGIATGLVVLGSIGTVVYRSSLGADGGSWVDGFREAAERSDPVLLGQVQDAFVSGFRAVGLFGVAVMSVVLVLQASRRKTGEASQPEAAREEALV
ncbi:MFS transporter [Glycomyces harbinensis]|uniref:MFS transporter, DHA2 family, multidrug resistance protein n=1 Tax=Glycomyces harbinensis TaxID=58114 RepID=A0A1G6QNJ3_9ACTN|nr:MFS transporter [Glycomyces harbinensis]SDC93791.1 MFS transporter, DHA2 family, multidrug resistance protein [Glycomyces harbinensis]